MPAWGGEGGEGGEPAIRGPVLGSPAPPLQGCLHVSPGPPPVGTLISGRKAEHVYTLHTRCPSGDEAGVHGCVWRCMCVTGSPAALLTAGRLPPPPPVPPRHPPKLQEWRCCSWTVLPWTLLDNASTSTAPCPWDT